MALIALGLGLESAAVAQPSAPPVSPICQLAFEAATQAGEASPEPSLGASTAPSDPSPVPSPDASASPAASGSAPPLPDQTAFDDAIRACASVDEWIAVAASQQALPDGADPLAFLIARCADPVAGLERYATCASLELALATPSPTVAPTPVPLPTLAPTEEGEADPSVTAEEPRLVRSPRRIAARVPGATSIRYFRIRGDSPNELIAQATRRSARFCPRHAAACVRYRPNVRARTETHTETGACRITGVTATLSADVFLPRWSMPKRVEPALLSWWRKMFRRIAAHEAQHIRIAEDALDELPRRIVGRPCSAFGPAFARWSSALTRRQDAFDVRDRQRPLPPYRGEER